MYSLFIVPMVLYKIKQYARILFVFFENDTNCDKSYAFIVVCKGRDGWTTPERTSTPISFSSVAIPTL